jgi:signal transduction histidine kinase
MFIAICGDDKPFLSRGDIRIIFCFFCGLLFQFLLIFTKTENVSYLFLVLSFLLTIPVVVYVTYKSQAELEKLLVKIHDNPSRKSLYERRIFLASRRSAMAKFLAYAYPLFPIIYYLNILQVLSQEWTFVGLLLASAFTKICFATICMNSNLEVSHPAIILIDAEKFAQTSRKAFLRFVFHEVRVPLNSISLGIQVLSNTPELGPAEHETINLMKEATNFMGETLNDVMALQTFEEGTTELILKPFCVGDLFQHIESSFQEYCQESQVTMKTSVDASVPKVMIGDKYRIRHVLANLVSNAIKYSFVGGLVELKATAQKLSPDVIVHPKQVGGEFLMIIFSVQDKGKGISKEDQEIDIFQPYRMLKHGELKRGRGSGLGLAICKEIVHLHGGEISYRSELGKGSTFYVHVPLEISHQLLTPSWNTLVRNRSASQGSNYNGFLDSHYHVLNHNASNSFYYNRKRSPLSAAAMTAALLQSTNLTESKSDKIPLMIGEEPSSPDYSDKKIRRMTSDVGALFARSLSDTALNELDEKSNKRNESDMTASNQHPPLMRKQSFQRIPSFDQKDTITKQLSFGSLLPSEKEKEKEESKTPGSSLPPITNVVVGTASIPRPPSLKPNPSTEHLRVLIVDGKQSLS